MLEEWRGRSEGELRALFRWQLPARYNIGVDCSDNQEPRRLAMVHIHSDGSLREVTYRDLAQDSNRLANALRDLGVQVGDRVCVSLPQHPSVAISHIAIYKLGAIAVPMTTLFGPDAFLYRLGDSGVSVMITDRVTAEKVATLRKELPNLRHILEIETDWDTLLAQGSTSFRAHETRLDDPALLIYTSGTTGDPKGALHGHRVLLGHLPGFELSHNFYGLHGDRFWTPADWAWIGGLYDALFPVLHHGSTIVSFASGGKFDPERAFDMMSRHFVRNAFLPPTALKMMRQEVGASSSHNLQLRTVMSGGESLGEEILSWGRETLGVTINEIYGQTEANYVVGNCNEVFPVRPGSMGKAYVGHDVAVLDSNGAATTEIGEVAVRRPDPVMFLGYWNRPEATQARFIGDWMLTGDTARLDQDGYFWFQGRNDDIINSAGYRIGPTEIEECLMRHPSVAQAAVIGIPDRVRGQVVKAFLVLRTGYQSDHALRADITQFVRTRLAAYEYPRVIEFLNELPLTTTGKIRRNELRVKSTNDPVEGRS